MTHVRRLLAVSAVLAIPAAFTLSHHLWGDSGKKDFQKVTPPAAARQDRSFSEELAHNKFADASVLTYRTAAGDLLFALQVQPKLESVAPRARDYLVLVDTSASKAQGPLDAAKKLTETLVSRMTEMASFTTSM